MQNPDHKKPNPRKTSENFAGRFSDENESVEELKKFLGVKTNNISELQKIFAEKVKNKELTEEIIQE